MKEEKPKRMDEEKTDETTDNFLFSALFALGTR